MKHFIFTFFLIILGLGQPEAYAQDNTEPTETPLPVITEQNERPAEESHKEEQTDIDQANQDSAPTVSDMEGKEIPALSSSDQISKNANIIAIVQAVFSFFTLLLAGLATWFAWGAWKAGRDSVKAARDTLASNRAWLVMTEGVNNIISGGEIKEKDGSASQFQQGIATNIGFVNTGNSPAIEVEMFHRGWKGEGEPPSSFTNLEDRIEYNATMMIGPQKAIHTAEKLIFDDEMNRWFRRELRWFLYAQATYRTIHTKEIQYVQIMIEVIPGMTDFIHVLNNANGVIIDPKMQKIGTLDENNKN